MALTKTQLKEILSAAGVTADAAEIAVTKIMEGHIASVNALREERDGFKADAEQVKADMEALKGVQKELDELKAKGDPDWQRKYEAERDAYAAYKADVQSKAEAEKKKSLYRELLTECKVGANQIDAVLKVTDMGELKVGKDGKLENADALKKSIEKDWSGFIMRDATKGADVEQPPAKNGSSKPTKDEIMSIKNTAERQRAIAANPELFGLA